MILANSSQASAKLFTFIILLSTAAVLVVYLAGALSAWRLVSSPAAKAIILVALLFIGFAFTGRAPSRACGGLALLAIGIVVRIVMHRLEAPAPQPSR